MRSPDASDRILRVVDWNVNGFALKGQPQLLASLEWDVALLQEVTRETWTTFRELGDDGAVAFDHLPPLADPGPRYASAVLVRGDVVLEGAGAVQDVPSPERALTADLVLRHQPFAVCSWAAPPGASWGDAGKGRQVSRFAAWLAARSGPVVVGIDRNAPKWERHDLADDEWWNDTEPVLYGPDRAHDLRDAYRDLVGREEALAAALRAERPDGPLAVTHRRRGGADCRYDAIYVSPEFDVLAVEHLWDEAREAGSDHALVRASLGWPSE